MSIIAIHISCQLYRKSVSWIVDHEISFMYCQNWATFNCRNVMGYM